MPPDRLQQMLTEAIRRVLDLDAFHAEQVREQQDAAELEAIRRTMQQFSTDEMLAKKTTDG